MSRIGQAVIEDMENHPELYDGDNEPDFTPGTLILQPLADINKLIDETLPF